MNEERHGGVAHLIAELRRRKVIRAALIYAAVAWGATEVLATVLPALYAPEWLLTLVVIAFIVGFPVAMFLAWAFDLGAEGVRRSKSSGARGWLSIVVAASLLLGGTAGLFVLIYPGSERNGDASEGNPAHALSNSVAVLPFADMTEAGDHEWFADGISETLMHNLAQYEELRVTARTSAFAFKGRNMDVRDIGRQLDVAAVLEGSVQRAGDTLRVTAQLVSASDGVHIWSQSYDRTAADLFEIQDEISRNVAATLVERLASDVAAGTPRPSLDAYDLYLLGLHHFHQRTADSLQRAAELFGEAIALQPDYALALSGLADTYVLMTYYGGMGVPEAAELAPPLIGRARRAAPELAEPQASQGLLLFRLRQFDDAEDILRKASELNPNYVNGWVWLGLNHVQQGRPADAVEAYRRAWRLDPLHGTLNRNMAASLMLMGQPDEAMLYFDRVLELEPQLAGTYGMIAHWLRVYGRLEEALEWSRRGLEAGKDPTSALAVRAEVFAQLGLWEEAHDYLEELRRRGSDEITVYFTTTAVLLERDEPRGFMEFARTELGKIEQPTQGVLAPLDRFRLLNWGYAQLLDGNYGAARNAFLRIFGGEQGLPDAVYDDVRALSGLAMAYRALGATRNADELLGQCLLLIEDAMERGWATPTLYYRRARILVLANRLDEALDSLTRAVELGFRTVQHLAHDPAFDALRGDPRFLQLAAGVREQLRRQRSAIIGAGLTTKARLSGSRIGSCSSGDASSAMRCMPDS